MKTRYRVEGLVFDSEKKAIAEASRLIKKRNHAADYVLIMISDEIGYRPYQRIYKSGRLQFFPA